MNYYDSMIENSFSKNLIDVPYNAVPQEQCLIELSFQLKGIQVNSFDEIFEMVVSAISKSMKIISNECGDKWDFYFPQLSLVPTLNSKITCRVFAKPKEIKKVAE